MGMPLNNVKDDWSKIDKDINKIVGEKELSQLLQ